MNTFDGIGAEWLQEVSTMHEIQLAGRPRLASAVTLAVLLVTSTAASAGASGKGLPPGELIFRDGVEEYLDLSGHAGFLEPLAGALVTVSSAGGKVVQGAADGTGGFLLRYEFVGAPEPVEVRVLGTGEQSEQEYAAWLGEPAFLLARAGADRILDQVELPALRVNAFQTGRYLAIRALPASELAPPGREPERLAASYHWGDAADRSSIIALLMAGTLEFPVGASTTLDAVSILPVAQPLQDEYKWGSYDRALLYPIGSDPQHVPLLAQPPFGQTLQTYSTFSPHGSPYGSTRVRLESDGTGSFATESVPEQAIAWNASPEGHVRITAAGGGSLSVEGVYYFHADCSCQRLHELHVVAARAGFAEGPRGNLLLSSSLEQEWRFPEEPGRPSEPLPSYRPNGLETALVDDSGLAAIEDPSGNVVWLNVLLEDGDYSYSTSEPHRFDANGSGATLHRDLAFTWQVDASGRLHMLYADGAESTTVRASADRDYGSTTVVHTSALGAVRPDAGIHLRQAPDVNFLQFDPSARTFITQVNCDRPFASLDEDCRSDFGFALSADQGGTTVGSSTVLQWEIDASGVLSIRRYTPEGSLTQRREWTLVSQRASSVIVFERILDFDGWELAARLVRYTY